MEQSETHYRLALELKTLFLDKGNDTIQCNQLEAVLGASL